VKRVLTITKFDPNEKACDHTRHLTGRERVSLLEDLRREMSKVTHREYPKRVRRVLEIVKRSECWIRHYWWLRCCFSRLRTRNGATPVSYISLPNLLHNKRESARPKDLADIDELGGNRDS
jgi:hypothetical protein